MVADRPPGPTWLDLVRALPAATRDPPLFLQGLVRRHGDLVVVRAGHAWLYVVGHPDLAREVLEAGPDRFVRGRGAAQAGRLLGPGLLVSEGGLHAAQRRRMDQLFTPEVVAAYADVVVERATALADRWDGEVVDVFDAMRDLTVDVVVRCLAPDVDEREAEGVVRAVATLAASFWRLFLPLSSTTERLPLRVSGEVRRARVTVESSITRHLDRARRGDADGMLSLILASRDPTSGDAMTRDFAAAEALSLLFGGRAGPGTGLAWSWLELSRHPEVEARMHAEIDEALKGRPPTLVDLPRLRFTRMVFAEALRRRPPAWILMRRAACDQRLLGHRVPEGAHVLISPYLIHHDPRFHTDPDRFDPERFEPERAATLHPYAFFPFGGGAMGCLGENFAWMECPLVLATLAQRWRLRTTLARDPAPAAFITLKPRGGLPMRPEPRSAGSRGS